MEKEIYAAQFHAAMQAGWGEEEMDDYDNLEEEVSPEVCQGCGTYFNHTEGRQLCYKCRQK